jgi:hypothetical protein
LKEDTGKLAVDRYVQVIFWTSDITEMKLRSGSSCPILDGEVNTTSRIPNVKFCSDLPVNANVKNLQLHAVKAEACTRYCICRHPSLHV